MVLFPITCELNHHYIYSDQTIPKSFYLQLQPYNQILVVNATLNALSVSFNGFLPLILKNYQLLI